MPTYDVNPGLRAAIQAHHDTKYGSDSATGASVIAPPDQALYDAAEVVYRKLDAAEGASVPYRKLNVEDAIAGGGVASSVTLCDGTISSVTILSLGAGWLPITGPVSEICKPSAGEDGDNDFHEVWWNSVAGGEAPSGKPKGQLHEVWQWMGDACIPVWRRAGTEEPITARNAYVEGWRYVRPIKLLNAVRRDGTPPDATCPDATCPDCC